MARTVRFHEAGGPDVLQIEDVDPGEPGAGEVRVRIAACGLNRAEAMYRRGEYIDKPTFPSLIGYEGSGYVEALGEGVEGFSGGDAVSILPTFSMTEYGIYAESAIVPVGSLAPIPGGLSMLEAAAVWMPLMTSYGALVADLDVGRGDYVLLTAGSSSVALMAMQIAHRQGAKVILTTRKIDKVEALRRAGADEVIVTGEQDLPAEVARITGGKGARLIFDPVGGSYLNRLAQAVSSDGKILVYGGLSGEQSPFPLFPPQDGGTPLPNGGRIRFYVFHEVLKSPQLFAAVKDYISSGLTDGAFKPMIDKVFPLEDVVAAHRYLESNAQVGKLLLDVGAA